MSSSELKSKIWIFRDYLRCSGCRLCEVACSLAKEGAIWPEASRVRVFMLAPGVEFPQLCSQCDDYPCVENCPVNALSVDDDTGAVVVDEEKCTGCGLCIDACPGKIPHLHPSKNKALICDLCGGDPECVKVCVEAGYMALRVVQRDLITSSCTKTYARHPREIARDLAVNLFGEFAEELI